MLAKELKQFEKKSCIIRTTSHVVKCKIVEVSDLAVIVKDANVYDMPYYTQDIGLRSQYESLVIMNPNAIHTVQLYKRKKWE